MPCRAPLQAAHRKGEKPIIYKSGRRPKTLAEGFEALELPCGQCAGCRLEKSRIWGARIAHEAAFIWEEYNLPSSFITLTYNEANLPLYGSLVPEHLQKFMKRLRRRIEPQKVRYYASGEYGSRCPKHELDNCPMCGPVQRPHYHAIILGYGFPDRTYVGEREGLPVYESDFLSKVWPFGFHEIGSCSFESAAYVARYVMKKQTGRPVDEGHYMRYEPWLDNWFEVEHEFAHMSKNPGIGKDWCLKYIDDLYPHDRLPIPGRGEYGIPPKYYDQVYTEFTGDDLTDIKEKRRKEFAESLVEGPSLESRAIVQDARINKLGRGM